MARSRTAPSPDLTDAEIAAAEHEGNGHVESEVRAEEFSRGIDEPVWTSPFPVEVVEALRAPLDPDRVRRRKGRGNTQYEYLAGHDVKRQMNAIFGFGNWGTKVVEQVELGHVDVQSSGDSPKPGVHVGYKATVEVSIKHGDGWVSYQDVGYGDGVEYGPAALVTARELAIKESVTDAFKRAATYLGDQFGLILYAKDDEKKRIAKTENENAAVVRAPDPHVPVPQSWTEALQRFDKLVARPGDGQEWLSELVEKRFDGATSLKELTPDQRMEAMVGFSSTLMALEETEADFAFPPANVREVIAQAFAEKNSGVKLFGPSWQLHPQETDRPVFGGSESQ